LTEYPLGAPNFSPHRYSIVIKDEESSKKKRRNLESDEEQPKQKTATSSEISPSPPNNLIELSNKMKEEKEKSKAFESRLYQSLISSSPSVAVSSTQKEQKEE
jgi:hypothetical protein